MTKRTRNIIFGILFIFFLMVAPLTVFYSLGWRFDWQSMKPVQTGIFYFKAWPKNSNIYINNELRDKTDIFFGSVLIDYLMPDKYDIKVTKEGYHDWQKTLVIKKKKVTEAKNITLIPNNVNFQPLVENVEEFFISPDNRSIVIKQENTVDKKTTWSLKLYELDNELKSRIVDETDFSTKGVDLFNITFSPNSERILLELGLKENIQYYLLDIKKSPVTITKLDFLDSPEKIFFHPKDNNKLLILQETKENKKTITTLNEVDISNKEILPPIVKDIVTCSLTDNNIYFLNNLGSVSRSDLSGEKIEKLNIIAFPYKEETDYEIIVSGSSIFLRENKLLYLFDEDTKSFKKLFDSLEDYQFSPDRNKLTYYSNNEIKVLFLEKQYDQPEKEKHEELFVTRFSEEINNVFWYTSHYLIFDLNNIIKVIELDNRDKMNTVDLADFNHEEMFFSNKKLYLLSEGTLYSSDQLTQ